MNAMLRNLDPNLIGRWRRQAVWALEAAAFTLVLALLAVLPRRGAARVGAAVTGLCGPLFSRQHARAMRRNLDIAFPAIPETRRSALQREIWRHLGRVLSTYSHLPPLLRRPDRGGAVEVEGIEHLSSAGRDGAFLLVGAHFGHWEMAGCYAAMLGHKIAALYTPESNPWIDRLIRHLRQKASAESVLIPRGPSAVRRMMEVLRQGRGLFIICDQRVDDGEWLPFFGRPAQTTTTPARLARRFGCPIVPARAVLLPDGRYRITYCEPLRPDPAREPDADAIATTTRLNALFESWIREEPGQWLCTKRRWPKSRSGRPAQAPEAAASSSSAKVPAAVD
jgi:KDO2-lipid IV(A) lauroyltransferase